MGLLHIDMAELREQATEWENRLRQAGERLSKCVRTRDRMRRQQRRLCGAFSVLLRHISKMKPTFECTYFKIYLHSYLISNEDTFVYSK